MDTKAQSAQIKCIELSLNLQRDGFMAHSKNLASIILKKNSKVQKCSWDSLKKIWPYAEPTEIEYVSTFYSGSTALFCLTVASGQGGIIAAWDVNKRKWIHVSNAGYVLDAILIPEINVIISLHFIQYWGVTGHLVVEARYLDKTRDCFAEISSKVELPQKIPLTKISEDDILLQTNDLYDGTNIFQSALIFLKNKTVIVQYAKERYQLSLNDILQSLGK